MATRISRLRQSISRILIVVTLLASSCTNPVELSSEPNVVERPTVAIETQPSLTPPLDSVTPPPMETTQPLATAEPSVPAPTETAEDPGPLAVAPNFGLWDEVNDVADQEWFVNYRNEIDAVIAPGLANSTSDGQFWVGFVLRSEGPYLRASGVITDVASSSQVVLPGAGWGSVVSGDGRFLLFPVDYSCGETVEDLCVGPINSWHILKLATGETRPVGNLEIPATISHDGSNVNAAIALSAVNKSPASVSWDDGTTTTINTLARRLDPAPADYTAEALIFDASDDGSTVVFSPYRAPDQPRTVDFAIIHDDGILEVTSTDIEQFGRITSPVLDPSGTFLLFASANEIVRIEIPSGIISSVPFHQQDRLITEMWLANGTLIVATKPSSGIRLTGNLFEYLVVDLDGVLSPDLLLRFPSATTDQQPHDGALAHLSSDGTTFGISIRKNIPGDTYQLQVSSVVMNLEARPDQAVLEVAENGEVTDLSS